MRSLVISTELACTPWWPLGWLHAEGHGCYCTELLKLWYLEGAVAQLKAGLCAWTEPPSPSVCSVVSQSVYTKEKLISPLSPAWSPWCVPPSRCEFSGCQGHGVLCYCCGLIPSLERWRAVVVLLFSVAGAGSILQRWTLFLEHPWPNQTAGWERQCSLTVHKWTILFLEKCSREKINKLSAPY